MGPSVSVWLCVCVHLSVCPFVCEWFYTLCVGIFCLCGIVCMHVGLSLCGVYVWGVYVYVGICLCEEGLPMWGVSEGTLYNAGGRSVFGRVCLSVYGSVSPCVYLSMCLFLCACVSLSFKLSTCQMIVMYVDLFYLKNSVHLLKEKQASIQISLDSNTWLTTLY